MSDQPNDGERTWITRLRDRRSERGAIRADRRARRKAHMGAGPDDAARQAESGNWQGGYFTTKTPPKD
jgi:hypothetical protein